MREKTWHKVTEVKCIHCMGTGIIKRKEHKKEVVTTIIKLHKAGNSLRKIAGMVGINNPQTVSNIIRKHLLTNMR